MTLHELNELRWHMAYDATEFFGRMMAEPKEHAELPGPENPLIMCRKCPGRNGHFSIRIWLDNNCSAGPWHAQRRDRVGTGSDPGEAVRQWFDGIDVKWQGDW